MVIEMMTNHFDIDVPIVPIPQTKLATYIAICELILENDLMSALFVRKVFYRHGLQCSICQISFSTFTALSKHQQYGHRNDDKPLRHQCSYCSYSSDKSCNLKKHIRTHSGERPYQCSVCLKRFADKSCYNRHAFIHK